MRIAVIGAGLAGLAAGVELKELGHHVELFERSRLLGGRATSFEIDGIEVDNGQHVFLFCCSEFLGFAKRVGFENELYVQKKFDALVISRDGKRGRLSASALPPPFHLMPSFARYPHLSYRGKLQIAFGILSVARRKAASEVEGRAHQTFEQWLQQMGQTEETRRAFWDPFFIPALNAPFDQVSVDDALFTLRTAFLGNAMNARFGYTKIPLAHLAARAAERLDAVHLQDGVTALDVADAGVTLSLSKGESYRCDAVVIATPPKAAAKLLGDAAKYGVENLDGYGPYPILDVHLWHDGGSIGFDFAAALESPLQWIFEKTPGYLSCSFSAAGDSMSMPTADLESLAWREVQTFIPSLQGRQCIRSAVTRNPEATWLPKVGARRTSQRTNHPAIAIAGSWTGTGWPDTMESAIRSGYEAARLFRRPTPA
ncbi:MAG TPA: hydroxysqualene dehydroxylase HpnE [Candidatus Baltobacteraceae bacterium]|nr:hydroxysqualene dehydroxylase HpnE [Candidatus Baltobacteraceae bacterium]